MNTQKGSKKGRSTSNGGKMSQAEYLMNKNLLTTIRENKDQMSNAE